MSQFVRHRTVTELSRYMGFGEPEHPLITIIDVSRLAYGPEAVGVKFTSDLYCIALKDSSCGMDYGRNSYDFDGGVLIFTAPDQVITLSRPQALGERQGWMLYFHPDLVRGLPLGDRMDGFSFFSYDVHEALHLSGKEQQMATACVDTIRQELEQRIDGHSRKVIVSAIELLLNYSSRFYERQFHTRSTQSRDVVSTVERLLKDYYNEGGFVASGPPSIAYLASACALSPSYLSDLLRNETGRSAKDHINDFIVEKAKDLLLSTNEPVSGIAYTLGFNYPHYFSRLFKSRTGVTPKDFRNN
ncbi:MAG: helix-turn-helix transcriptional regulator [Flavobacteriales bacterium]|nr:helix-turn-helix transcriptional regulator [Flavobacteriales bacterium]